MSRLHRVFVGPVLQRLFGALAWLLRNSARRCFLAATLPCWFAASSAALVTQGQFDTPGSLADVEVVGGIAYLAEGDSGLRILDVSNPAKPVELGVLDTPGIALDVDVVKGLAYLADHDSGLRIIDVSNPRAPEDLGVIDTPGSACGIAVRGNVVYLADGSAGLQLIDISNPAAPTELATLDLVGGGYANGVEVVEEFAYVVDDTLGLRIIDVSIPTAPVELGAIDVSGAIDVEVSDGIAYLVGVPPRSTLELPYPASLWLIDVSNPAEPVKVGEFISREFIYAVHVVDGLAYLTESYRAAYSAPLVLHSRLRILDVSDPSTPVDLTCTSTLGAPNEVVIAAGFAYVANADFDWRAGLGWSGLQIIDLESENSARPN